MKEEQSGGFKELLSNMMKRRWFITAIVLGGFMIIIMGIFGAILNKSAIEGEWKELLLLLLGAFIGSYGKIIDYWFSDTDKDKMLVQKMDEEDGTGDGKIDEYFTHRQCEHVWGDSDGDGDLECLKCGKIKDPELEEMEG